MLAELSSLFITFLKLGAFIFGSGHALAQAMQNEIVFEREWLTMDQFQEGWAAGNALPGPIAPKVVAYTGYLRAGMIGAYVSVIAYLLPSVTGMAALAAALVYEGGEGFVGKLLDGLKSAVRGIKPAVLAVLLEAFLSYTGVSFPKGASMSAQWMPLCAVAAGSVLLLVGMRMMAEGDTVFLLSDGRALAVFALSFIAMAGLGWSAIYIMLGAAAVGLSYMLF